MSITLTISQKVCKPVIANGAKQSRSLKPVEKSRLPRRFAPRNDDTCDFLRDQQLSFHLDQLILPAAEAESFSFFNLDGIGLSVKL